MSSASKIRLQIESALSSRIPSALSPTPKVIRSVAPTGIESMDALLKGGLPVGAITEIVGPECSGRTALSLSFIAHMTETTKVCAWVDVSNTLHPESAAAIGVDLSRLLWIRCGVPRTSSTSQSPHNSFSLPEKFLIPPPTKKGLHGGGFGPHPRGEIKGLSDALRDLLQPGDIASRRAEPQQSMKIEREACTNSVNQLKNNRRPAPPIQPWSRLDQALRVTDLLLQAGGFSAIVLDMGSIAPEYALRVPLVTWFRYRTAAEQTQTSILLLTQRACAKSSTGLVLRLQAENALQEEPTIFTGIEHRGEIVRQRFTQPATNIIPFRKAPQRESGAAWRSKTTWTGCR